MKKNLITPFMMWLLFMIADISALVKGIANQQSLQIAVAGVALLISTGILLTVIQRHNTRQLKAVRVRVRN